MIKMSFLTDFDRISISLFDVCIISVNACVHTFAFLNNTEILASSRDSQRLNLLQKSCNPFGQDLTQALYVSLPRSP